MEERLANIEKMLCKILNILTKYEKLDFKNKKFLCLENIFDITNDSIPMIKQGSIYTIDSNNTVSFYFDGRNTTLSVNELIELYGDKIHWLN